MKRWDCHEQCVKMAMLSYSCFLLARKMTLEPGGCIGLILPNVTQIWIFDPQNVQPVWPLESTTLGKTGVDQKGL